MTSCQSSGSSTQAGSNEPNTGNNTSASQDGPDTIFVYAPANAIEAPNKPGSSFSADAKMDFQLASFPNEAIPPESPSSLIDLIDQMTFDLHLRLNDATDTIKSSADYLGTAIQPCVVGTMSYGSIPNPSNESFVTIPCTLSVDEPGCQDPWIRVSGGLVVVVQDALPDSIGDVKIQNIAFSKDGTSVPYGTFTPDAL